MALSTALHRRPEVWGPDAAEFDPDHFDPARRADIPPNAYKPFGTGVRACIGRQFALQEAILVLAMVLQRFELVDHANYQLKIKESITIKPEGLTIQVRPRPGRTHGSAASNGTLLPSEVRTAPVTHASAALRRRSPVPVGDRHGTPLLVLFGSNLGAAEDIATRIARDGTDRGWATTVAPLDDRVGAVRTGEASPSSADLPTEGAVVVVSASYNGMPPDNAARVLRLGAPGQGVRGGGAVRGVRVRQPGLGLHLPGGPDPDRRPPRRPPARPGSTRAARATPAATSTASSRPGTTACGTHSGAACGVSAADATRRCRRTRGCASRPWRTAARRARWCARSARSRPP